MEGPPEDFRKRPLIVRIVPVVPPAILDDFAPLQAWLQEQDKGQPIGW